MLKTNSITINNGAVNPQTDENIIDFFIQIAASRSPLDSQFLKSIYSGPHHIEQRNEDNWFKYQIGQTDKYLDALKNIRQIKIPGAFIVAYAGDEKQNLWKVINSNKTNLSKENLIYEQQLSTRSKTLRDLRATEEETLNSYKVLNADSGRYQIPIEQAMKLMADEAYQRRLDDSKK